MKREMDEDLYSFYKHCAGNVGRITGAKWSNVDEGLVISFNAPDYAGQLTEHNMVLIPVTEYDKKVYRLYTPDYDNYDEF